MAKAAKQTVKKTTKRTTTGTTGSAATKRTTTPRKSVKKSRERVMPTEEQIRQRAFEIFLTRSDGPGDAHSDWLQAERELVAEMSR